MLANFIFVQHEIASDQRYYLSLAGLAISIGTIILEKITSKKISINRRTIQNACFVLLAFSGLTIWRETYWLTDDALWQSDLKCNSRNARSLGMLANAKSTDDFTTAASYAKQSLSIDPGCAPANETLGVISVSKKNYREAIGFFEKAIADARNNQTVPEKLSFYLKDLAEAAMKAEDWGVAKKAAIEALKVRPGIAKLHLVLGCAFLAEKNYSKAMEELTVGAPLNKYDSGFLEPTVEACLAIGTPRFIAFGYSEAKKAIKIVPGLKPRYNYIRAALELRKVSEAKQALKSLLSGDTKSAECSYLWYWAEKLDHQESSAKLWKEQALKIDPAIESKFPIVPLAINDLDALTGKKS
jgi:tetratricopeptide (TPR) repeat protein